MGSWSRRKLDNRYIYVSEYENCPQKTLVQGLLRLISCSILLFEVPQTTLPQQQGAHLKFRILCEPEATPKPKNLRSLQHTPNRHRQIGTAQKIPLFSKTQLEAIVPYITQAYSWSTQGSHFQALPTLRQHGHTLSSRTTSWSEKQEWGVVHWYEFSPTRAKLQISHSWQKAWWEDSTAQWLGNLVRKGKFLCFTQAMNSHISVRLWWWAQSVMSPLKKPCYGDLPPEKTWDSAACRHWAVLSLCYGLFQGSFCCVCRFPPNPGMHYRGRLCIPALCLYWAFLGQVTEDTCFSPK